ncbi:MAG: nucleotidyltransferase domain-containing protein [Clostridia bacterium]|nr:nucleotidyltransferase domain-containing protein [Clostridia bacterium]
MFEERLREAAELVCAQGYFPIYISLHGSQNYGLAICEADYRSDYDFKCIVLPSLWDLVEGKRPASLTVEMDDGGQIDIKDIRIFCDALERMNPAYLESVATEHYLILPDGEGMGQIRAQLPLLMRERAGVFARTCSGLFEDKAQRMCHDSPAVHERITKFGYDGKQPHHMFRLMHQLKTFEQSGEFVLEAPKEAQALLMRLKKNKIPLEDVCAMIPDWRAEIRETKLRIEQKCGEPKTDACDRIRRIAQEMMHAHCLKG